MCHIHLPACFSGVIMAHPPPCQVHVKPFVPIGCHPMQQTASPAQCMLCQHHDGNVTECGQPWCSGCSYPVYRYKVHCDSIVKRVHNIEQCLFSLSRSPDAIQPKEQAALVVSCLEGGLFAPCVCLAPWQSCLASRFRQRATYMLARRRVGTVGMQPHSCA